MSIPNILTILRIILVPIFLIAFFSNMTNAIMIAGVIFILAGISDFLDGYIARKYDMGTKLGAVLDPLADKLMTFAVLISFTLAKLIPYWIPVALCIKEAIMIVGGAILYLFKGKQVMPSNNFGKVATVFFYLAALSVIFRLPDMITKILFIITLLLNLVAFINYLLIYIKIKEKAFDS